MRNWNDNITKNFKYRELLYSKTADNYRISNVPNTNEIWTNLEKLTINILQPIRDHFGPIKINSAYRSEELNNLLHASKYSNHLKGQAADIVPVNKIPLYTITHWIYNNLNFKELIAEYFPYGWIHVAYREGENNNILKLKDEYNNYRYITIEYLKLCYGVNI